MWQILVVFSAKNVFVESTRDPWNGVCHTNESSQGGLGHSVVVASYPAAPASVFVPRLSWLFQARPSSATPRIESQTAVPRIPHCASLATERGTARSQPEQGGFSGSQAAWQ